MNFAPAAAAPPSGRRMPLALSSLVMALGFSAVLGWHLHIQQITYWMTGTEPIAYNAAMSLVVLGAALLAAILGRRRLSAALAILGGLAPLLTLFEYAAGVSLGIDELFMKFGGSSAYPGRISPNSSLCLLLLSVAILSMTTPGPSWLRKLGSPLLVSIALGISAVSAAGYLTGFATYGWVPLIPMAVPTSAGLMLLSVALLSIHWREGRTSDREVPSWLFIAVTVAAVVMTISLWQTLASEEHDRGEQAVAAQLEIVRVGLLTDLGYRIGAVNHFARRWERTGLPDQQQWDFEIGLLVKDVQGFEVIGWADPAFRIRWIYPREKNEALLNADLGSDAIRCAALEMARDLRRTILTPPMKLLAGGTGINAYTPVYRGAAIQGFVVAGFRFQDLFPHVVDSALAPGYAVAIYDGNTRIYFRAPPGDQGDKVWQRQASLQVENSNWTLQVWPTPSALAAVESTGSRIVLAAGLLLAVLLGLAVYLAQAAHLKTGLAEQARGELEKEVAERRRVERELEEFFAVTPDMLCIAGFDGYFKRVNSAWVNALGWSVEQLLETPFANFVHPGDVPATRGAVEQLQAGDSVVSFENRYRARDGSYRWMRWNSRPSPERRLIFAAARDVTAEKAANEELRRGHEELERRVRERTAELENVNRTLYEREELFRRLFEESPIGTVLAGLDRKINRVNRAFCNLLGYSTAELSALTFDDLTPVDDVGANVEFYRRMYFGELSGSRLVRRYVRKDGKIVWVNLTATVIRDELGNPLTSLAMAEDITERMIREDEISRLNLELEARVGELTGLNQELESFNYSVSHDLRAPLRHIDAFSKILLDQYAGALPQDGHRSLQRIREGVGRMGRMVDELLELSRTSRREVSKEVTGLGTLLAEVLEDLKREVGDREIEWRIGALPFADCDPALLRQVFANLLANAVKFTRHRKPAVIEVGQTVSRGLTVLFVRDNGVGFSMKYVDKLFGIFQRLHRREDFEGTGVGLVTVQRIVQKHGGRIWAEAELEKGATFYFTLEPPGEPQTEEPSVKPTAILAGGR